MYEKEQLSSIRKAPHYYLVTFHERSTSVNGMDSHFGKPVVIICDDVPVNVYGLKEDEVATFDPLRLRNLLIGIRTVTYKWEAETDDQLLKEIIAYQPVADGVYEFIDAESLPICERMHAAENGQTYCGKPMNEYGDGCCGGCVLDKYDQEEKFSDGFICPIQKYWREKSEKRYKPAA